jgi:hypothetical protein
MGRRSNGLTSSIKRRPEKQRETARRTYRQTDGRRDVYRRRSNDQPKTGDGLTTEERPDGRREGKGLRDGQTDGKTDFTARRMERRT